MPERPDNDSTSPAAAGTGQRLRSQYPPIDALFRARAAYAATCGVGTWHPSTYVRSHSVSIHIDIVDRDADADPVVFVAAATRRRRGVGPPAEAAVAERRSGLRRLAAF